MKLDVEACRHETPGVDHATYVNNATSPLQSTDVFGTVASRIDREAKWGATRAALEMQEDLTDVRTVVAVLIGAEPEEISFCEHCHTSMGLSATETERGLSHERATLDARQIPKKRQLGLDVRSEADVLVGVLASPMGPSTARM